MKLEQAKKYHKDIFAAPADAHENAQRQLLDDITCNLRYLGCEKLDDANRYIQIWNVNPN